MGNMILKETSIDYDMSFIFDFDWEDYKDTSIHNNVTGGHSDYYGLHTESFSSIHLVSPLTKESVSINNGGGGNYGGDGTIETIYGRGFFLRDRIL